MSGERRHHSGDEYSMEEEDMYMYEEMMGNGGHHKGKKHQVKVNFRQIFAELAEMTNEDGSALTTQQRYEKMLEREDFDMILKAVKMRAMNQLRKMKQHGDKKESKKGHQGGMMNMMEEEMMDMMGMRGHMKGKKGNKKPHTPAEHYAEAFNRDVMFYQPTEDQITEVENPKYGMEKLQKMRKWA